MMYERNRVRLAFDDQGTGDAVLFIHGHPFNRSMWLPQVEALRASFRVVTPDLRGYGDSTLGTAESAIRLEDLSEDLAALLNQLGISKATIVGLSMGGQIAMELARAFPERVTGLVLAATFPRAETEEGVIERNRIADRLLVEGIARFGCEMLPKLIGTASMTRFPALAANVYRMICTTDPVAAAAALRGRAMRRDYTDVLSTINVPALVIVGTDDAYTDVEEAKGMHRQMRNSRLEVFEDIGHMPNLEDPRRFNELLREFLSIVRGAKAD